MIEFEDFSFRYPLSHDWALKNINFKIHRGEFVLVVGPSGGGKTTLLRAINGLIPHFYSGTLRGTVRVCDRITKESSVSQLAEHVSTVFQNIENQIIMSTVDREIAFPLENRGFEESQISRRVEEALEVIGIAHLKGRKISHLSGGEKQKVAIAASIATRPDFILLDEPTSQLSPNSAEDILSLLERLNDEFGMGIILVEHRLERLMHRVDRLIVIHNGKVLDDGEPRIVASRIDLDALGVGYPQVARVARYLGKRFLPLTVKEGRKTLEEDVKRFKLKSRNPSFEDPILKISDLYFSYDKGYVLRGINLKLRRGEILGIIGRNGSGKTTLAKLITGILQPEKGMIIIPNVKGKNGKGVAMVFQNPDMHLFGETIYEDISLGVKDGKKVENIMKTLGIWELKNRNSRDLSGGERMLAAIASVAVLEPEILILDEPTRGLSYSLKLKISKFLRSYARSKGAIIISHDMEMIARTADTVAFMADGRIIAHGDKRDIMPNSINYTTQLNKIMVSVKGANPDILVEEDVEGLI
ncbi:ATPase component of various ABC-type transport systems with duplicated ATPase domain [Aciduliprofundum sp. MAR08-339]|uniref:ABC transporter ATP-binding protein n=1 Tax=Aciduliprofundum sp. (strain MAR08-339) TaxID=673860 RepID=UPI0002A4AE44|nr:ATPase component of various ABC-type transport systems with duplicated ATPase domain [Aciduliprofundum sp. MAR08-339]